MPACRFDKSYNFSGFFLRRSLTFLIPILYKSFAMDLPMPGIICNSLKESSFSEKFLVNMDVDSCMLKNISQRRNDAKFQRKVIVFLCAFASLREILNSFSFSSRSPVPANYLLNLPVDSHPIFVACLLCLLSFALSTVQSHLLHLHCMVDKLCYH